MQGRGRAHSGGRALSIDKVPKVLPLPTWQGPFAKSTERVWLSAISRI